MNRVKDYAGFVGWFAGLGYIVLWPVTAADLTGKPFGASVFCYDGSSSVMNMLCNSAHPLHMPPGLHVLGFLSSLFVTTRLLVYAVVRSRCAAKKRASLAAASAAQASAEPQPPPLRKIVPPRPQVKPRSHFGLRGMRQPAPISEKEDAGEAR